MMLKDEEKQFDKIYDDFKNLRDDYTTNPLLNSNTPLEKSWLLTLNDQFLYIYNEIRPICSKIYAFRTSYDDKSSSAKRYRIAKGLINDGEKNGKKVSWNMAGEMAHATQEYEDFLKERVYYYESWDSISHLRDTIKQYIYNINQRIQNI